MSPACAIASAAAMTARRSEGSGVLMAGSGKSKPAARDVYSIDRAGGGEAKESAELRLEAHDDVYDVAGVDGAIEHEVVDAAEEAVPRGVEHEAAGELRHRLGDEELRIIGGAEVFAFDGPVVDAAARACRAEGDLVGE